LDHFHLAHPGHAGQAAGESFHHAILECAQAVDVDQGLAVGNAVVRQRGDFVHHRRGMQERLGRNAADVQAHAAQGRVTLDQHGFHPEVGRAKRSRVTARARAQHHHFAFDVGHFDFHRIFSLCVGYVSKASLLDQGKHSGSE
jgi:hypothetical protein